MVVAFQYKEKEMKEKTREKIAYTTREIRDIFIFYVTNEAMISVM